jgi:hypothetical protein
VKTKKSPAPAPRKRIAPAPPAPPAPVARTAESLSAAANKAWATRRANGWTSPQAQAKIAAELAAAEAARGAKRMAKAKGGKKRVA